MKSITFTVLISVIAVSANVFIPQPIVPLKDLKLQKPRIIDGQPAEPGQFPFQAVNSFDTPVGYNFCGGTLICDRWILTAAHCAKGAISFMLYLGSVNQSQIIEEGRVVIISKTAIVHERYDELYLTNDVALIKLDIPVQFTDKIQPIPLGRTRIGENEILTVSGWGITGWSEGVSPVLNYVNLRSISNSECRDVYGPLVVRKSTICCKGFPHHSTCSGDSGGPLIVKNAQGKFELVGVVSFVHVAGCDSGNPSGYVRVESLRSWIISKINGTCELP